MPLNIEYKNLQEMETSVDELFVSQDPNIHQSLSLLYNNFRTFLFGRFSIPEIANLNKGQLRTAINDWLGNAIATGAYFKNLFKNDKYLTSIYNTELFFKIRLDNGIKSMLFDNYLASLMSNDSFTELATVNVEQTL